MIIFFLLQVISEGLELYLIPHSHCDAGWLETFDTYFELKVKNILRNVVTLLEEDENRRFSWSETSFLKMWIENEDKKITNKFKELVAKKRIEIVGGGYVQNDEASTDFDMIIRQIEIGHQYLHKEFGIDKVKTGWQIDIFGHSALTPGIFSKFGYEFLVINRINEDFRSQLQTTQGMEFIWKGVNFGSNESIFTHVLYDFYYPLFFLRTNHNGPCFGNAKPLEADIRECVAMLYNKCKDWSQGYRTKKLMMVYGGDFFYNNITEGRLMFERIEQLIDWQKDSGLYKQLKIKFATPSEYFEDIKKSNKKYPVYSSDFFPYQSYREITPAFWTGFYSTRPSLKQLINKAHRLARAAEIAKSLIHGEAFEAYNASLALHHDAITGTSKPWVVEDYKVRLESDCEKAYQAICETISSVFTKEKSDFSLALPYKVLILYNSINWDKVDLITIDSDIQHLEVKNWRGEDIESEYIANHNKTAYTIYLKLTLPALSFVTLFITVHTTPCSLCSKPFILKEQGVIVSDKFYSIEFDPHGYVQSIKNSQKKYELIQEFWSYPAERAGAYLFEPTNEGYPISDLNLESFEIWQGSVANIVEVRWKRIEEKIPNYDHYYQKIILYGEKNFIWKYGLYATENKEILVRFRSNDILAGDWFYTSNSGDLRIRKYLDSKIYLDKNNTKIKKPLIPEDKGENMYPAPGGFAISMGKEAFKIFPQFSLGLGIVNCTSFEILMHRNAPLDDSLGLGEGVDDKSFTNYNFMIELGPLFQPEFKKSSLNTKADIYQFWIRDPVSFETVKDMKNAYNFNENWKYKSKYELGFNYSHIYLSSAVIKENRLLFRFWNLKNSYSGISSENYSFGRRMLLDGYSRAVILAPWEENGKEIDFKKKSQTGIQLIDPDLSYKDRFQGDQVLKPCELATFSAIRVLKHFWSLESENKNPFFLQNSREGWIRENETDENWSIFCLIIISLAFLGVATGIYLKLKTKTHKNKDSL